MRLSLLTILFGLCVGLPQVYGLAKPAKLGAAARKFPRSLPAGVFLMLFGTAWFVWNVNIEPIADFSVFKPYMIGAFIAIGVGACIFVQDFLAVRGLAVVLLLLGKLMVDTGRPHLGDSRFVLVIQTLAYIYIVLGIWFTITPWRLRDFINWATATESRTRLLSGVRLAGAIFILVLGLTAFHGM